MEEPAHSPARPLFYPPDARPPWRTALLGGLPHVLAMFVPVISVPLILGQALGLPAEQNAHLVSMGLLASGLGTLVQSGGAGPFGSPRLAVQGTSFAFLAPLLQAGKTPGGGLGLMLGMSLACAPVEIVLAQFLYRLRRVFTPLVSGVAVLLIGLSLVPVGMKGGAGGTLETVGDITATSQLSGQPVDGPGCVCSASCRPSAARSRACPRRCRRRSRCCSSGSSPRRGSASCNGWTTASATC